MLRNKSRAVTTKQALMADHQASLLLSPTTKNPSSPISSFLNSPRFFNGFLSKNLFSDTETTTTNNNVMSPTSILDTNIINTSCLVNPFGCDSSTLSKSPNSNPKNNSSAKQDTKAIGLALIDTIIEGQKNDESGLPKFSKPINRTSLYGSKPRAGHRVSSRDMKVQIPAVTNPTTSISPKSPADFGIKTGNNPRVSSPCSGTQVRGDFTRQLSLKEMELSEDYTCVINHGPNPKTTHIFDDCIVGEYDDNGDSRNYGCKKMDCGFKNNVSTHPSEDFLSFCHTCKDILGQGKDIYIYRGEKAFCSHECRCQEIFFEGMTNPELNE